MFFFSVEAAGRREKTEFAYPTSASIPLLIEENFCKTTNSAQGPANIQPVYIYINISIIVLEQINAKLFEN